MPPYNNFLAIRINMKKKGEIEMEMHCSQWCENHLTTEPVKEYRVRVK